MEDWTMKDAIGLLAQFATLVGALIVFAWRSRDWIAGRLDALRDNMERDRADLKSGLASIQTTLARIDAEHNGMTARVQVTTETLASLQRDMQSLDRRVTRLEAIAPLLGAPTPNGLRSGE